MIAEPTHIPEFNNDPADNTDIVGKPSDPQERELNEIQLRTLSQRLSVTDAASDYIAGFSDKHALRREEFLNMFSELSEELYDVFESGVKLYTEPFEIVFAKRPSKNVTTIKIPSGGESDQTTKGFIAVSRLHAGLSAKVDDEGHAEVRVFDLGSTNHTWVNGELVEDIDQSMTERISVITKVEEQSHKPRKGVFARLRKLATGAKSEGPLKIENIWNEALMEGKLLRDGDVLSLGRISQGNGAVHLYVSIETNEGLTPILNLIPIPAAAAGILANINKSLSRSFDREIFKTAKKLVLNFNENY